MIRAGPRFALEGIHADGQRATITRRAELELLLAALVEKRALDLVAFTAAIVAGEVYVDTHGTTYQLVDYEGP